MLTLAAHGWEAVILPQRGATFARLAMAGRDLLVPIPPGDDAGTAWRGAFLMAPWTNRLDGGRFPAQGREWRMPLNRPDEGNALHGFLRELPWTVEDASPDAATLSCTLDHPPFRLAARLEVALSGPGFSLSLALTNTGEAETPVGMGWHPFFLRPAGTRLRLRARTIFGRDARNLAIGPRPTTGIDGADAVLEGLHDAHLAGWDGAAEILLPDGHALVLRADGAWRGNAHLFAPRGRGFLCVEPVSHAPNAANDAAAAAHGAMHVLAPGDMLRASLMIHWR
jgi:aldose 1-epimerase